MTAYIKVAEDNSLQVGGELSFETVMQVWRDSLKLLATSNLHFDLSAVTHSNSAAVALLLQWYEYAVQQKRKIFFDNIPQALKSIIATLGLQQLF